REDARRPHRADAHGAAGHARPRPLRDRERGGEGHRGPAPRSRGPRARRRQQGHRAEARQRQGPADRRELPLVPRPRDHEQVLSMREPTIARNYAETAMELARRADDIHGWSEMLDNLGAAVESDRTLRMFLE